MATVTLNFDVNAGEVGENVESIVKLLEQLKRLGVDVQQSFKGTSSATDDASDGFSTLQKVMIGLGTLGFAALIQQSETLQKGIKAAAVGLGAFISRIETLAVASQGIVGPFLKLGVVIAEVLGVATLLNAILRQLEGAFAAAAAAAVSFAATLSTVLLIALAQVVQAVGDLTFNLGERLLNRTKELIAVGVGLDAQMNQLAATVQQYRIATGDASVSTESLLATVNRLAKTTGITRQELKEGVTTMLALTGSTGLTAAQVEELSARAADFAFGRGLRFLDVVIGIDNAFRGYADTLLIYGVNVKKEVLETSRFTAALGKTFDELTRAEKAHVLYNEILLQTEGFQGFLNDSLKTVAGSFNQAEIAITRMRNEMGTALVEVVEPFIIGMNATTVSLARLSEQMAGFVAPAIAAVGVLSLGIGIFLKFGAVAIILTKGVELMSKAFRALGVGARFASRGLAGTGPLGQRLSTIFSTLSKRIFTLGSGLLSVGGFINKIVVPGVRILFGAIVALTAAVAPFIAKLAIASAVLSALAVFFRDLFTVIIPVKDLVSALGFTFSEQIDIVKEYAAIIGRFFLQLPTIVGKSLSIVFSSIVAFTAQLGVLISNVIAGFFRLLEPLGSVFSRLSARFQESAEFFNDLSTAQARNIVMFTEQIAKAFRFALEGPREEVEKTTRSVQEAAEVVLETQEIIEARRALLIKELEQVDKIAALRLQEQFILQDIASIQEDLSKLDRNDLENVKQIQDLTLAELRLRGELFDVTKQIADEEERRIKLADQASLNLLSTLQRISREFRETTAPTGEQGRIVGLRLDLQQQLEALTILQQAFKKNKRVIELIEEAKGEAIATNYKKIFDLLNTEVDNLTESLRNSTAEAFDVLGDFFTDLASKAGDGVERIVSLFSAGFSRIISEAVRAGDEITAALLGESLVAGGFAAIVGGAGVALSRLLGGRDEIDPTARRIEELIKTLQALPEQMAAEFRVFIADLRRSFSEIFQTTPQQISREAVESALQQTELIRDLVRLQEILVSGRRPPERFRQDIQIIEGELADEVRELGRRLGIEIDVHKAFIEGRVVVVEHIDSVLEQLTNSLEGVVEPIEDAVNTLLTVVDNAFQEIDRLTEAREQFVSNIDDRIREIQRAFFSEQELFDAMRSDLEALNEQVSEFSGERLVEGLEDLADLEVEIFSQGQRMNDVLAQAAERFRGVSHSIEDSILRVQELGLQGLEGLLGTIPTQKEQIELLKDQLAATSDNERRLEIISKLQEAFVKLAELDAEVYSPGTLEFSEIQAEALTGLRDIQDQSNAIVEELESQMLDLDQLQLDILKDLQDLQERGLTEFDALISIQQDILITIQELVGLGSQLLDAQTIGNALLDIIADAEQALIGAQHGAIVTKPTKLVAGEGGKPEAIVPLGPRGELPINLKGVGQAQQGTTIVQVEHLYARDLDSVIDEANSEAFKRQKGTFRTFVKKQDSRITNMKPS